MNSAWKCRKAGGNLVHFVSERFHGCCQVFHLLSELINIRFLKLLDDLWQLFQLVDEGSHIRPAKLGQRLQSGCQIPQFFSGGVRQIGDCLIDGRQLVSDGRGDFQAIRLVFQVAQGAANAVYLVRKIAGIHVVHGILDLRNSCCNFGKGSCGTADRRF